MATLNDLRLSISELTRDEAFKLILAIRANRRVQKKNFFKQEKASAAQQKTKQKAELIKTKKALSDLSEVEKIILKELLKNEA